MVGAMGSGAATALGRALAQPDGRVLALTGDAELLMGVGSLATIGVRRPKNLAVVVLDNGRFGETGGQVSHTAEGVDIAGIAESCGVPVVCRVSDSAGIADLRERLHRDEGPILAVVPVDPHMPPVVMPIRDGLTGARRFCEALLGHDALQA